MVQKKAILAYCCTVFFNVVTPYYSFPPENLRKQLLGPDIDGQFVGSFAHSDDSIRMIRASRVTLSRQIESVENFAMENALILNT